MRRLYLMQEKHMPKTKSIRELRRELKVKERVLGKIQVRRAKFQAKLEALDRKIALLNGGAKVGRGRAVKSAPVARRTRKHPGGGKSLPDTIHEVLGAAPKGLRVKEITQGVLDAGYKTASKKFYGLVASAVRDPKKFKKVRHGVYRLA
jgi:hypothetical protein